MEVSVKVRHFMLGGMNYNLKCKAILAVVTYRLGVIYKQSKIGRTFFRLF